MKPFVVFMVAIGMIFPSLCGILLAQGQINTQNTGKVKVAIGDRPAQVLNLYGPPDSKEDLKPRYHRKGDKHQLKAEKWNYEKLGLAFCFIGTMLNKIIASENYHGTFEGIRIGDTIQIVQDKLGSPDMEPHEGHWVYYKGYAAHERSVIVDFDRDKRVRRIEAWTGAPIKERARRHGYPGKSKKG